MPAEANETVQRQPAPRRRSNARTALLLFVVAICFYFAMIFIGPLSR